MVNVPLSLSSPTVSSVCAVNLPLAVVLKFSTSESQLVARRLFRSDKIIQLSNPVRVASI